MAGPECERVEQLVTRKIEERVAQNIRVSEITSTSRPGLSVVAAEVDENARLETGKEFDDIKVKLDALTDLPEGAGPIQFIKEFGETSALMLTVASPPANGPRLQLLATQIAAAPCRRLPCWTWSCAAPVHPIPRSCAKRRACWAMPWCVRASAARHERLTVTVSP